MGNFSVSHYAGIKIKASLIELRYLIDMAEIPTFQEIQQTGIVPKGGDASLDGYLARKAEVLKQGLVLEVNGQPLGLQLVSQEVMFPPGAGGLATMKLGFLYRAPLVTLDSGGLNHLHYRDSNFPGRAGWKEIVAEAEAGIAIVSSSVSGKDRSLQLSNYPTGLLNSPPQDLEANLSSNIGGFGVRGSGFGIGRRQQAGAGSQKSEVRTQPKGLRASGLEEAAIVGALGSGSNPKSKIQNPKSQVPATLERFGEQRTTDKGPRTDFTLRANQQATPRNAFTELMATKQWGFWILLAAAVATGLGALHALEPGHGKTIVAAYLVGSQGTAMHAFLLGLIVTASHTAGVYLLGLVTLYASRYIVPERLYPWLGVVSGVTIAGMGVFLFLRRYAGETHGHSHPHPWDSGFGVLGSAEGRKEQGLGAGGWGLGAEVRSQESEVRKENHSHSHQHHHGHAHHHHHGHGHELEGSRQKAVGSDPHLPSTVYRLPREVSYRQLLALGITGGIVPCPAALVVLLSAVALHRVGFGLFLIVAFSMGLAAVLIVIGLLVVYAGRFISRLRGDGPLINRWLPLTSAAVITFLGVMIAVRGLLAAGILQIRI